MKILFLNPTGTIGGAEMCLLDLLASLRAERPGWRLDVVLGGDGPLRPAVEALGVPATVLPLPGHVARLGDAGLGLGRAGPGEARPRLNLVARGPAAAWPTAPTGKAPKLDSRRGPRPRPDQRDEGPRAGDLGGPAARSRSSGTCTIISGLAPVMARLLALDGRRAGLGRGGLALGCRRRGAGPGPEGAGPTDLQRGGPRTLPPRSGRRHAARRGGGAAAAPPGTVRVGLVATFARWKGHDVFLEAAARVDPALPCRFYVVGGPIYQSVGSQWSLEELRGRAEALGLDGRLGFAGHQADPASAFRALDVVVHASTRPEPFGRVIVEAMACGRAVVATPHGGAAELFEPGVSALGCPPGDPDALAAAIARLVADPGLRRRLGAGGAADRPGAVRPLAAGRGMVCRSTHRGRVSRPGSRAS